MPRSERLRRRPRTSMSARGGRTFQMMHPDRSASAHSSAVVRLKDWKVPDTGIGEAWQREAYGYADVIGELGYVVNLTANTVAEGNVIPSEWDEEARAYKPTEDERVRRVWRAFVGPRGGQAELLRKAAIHMQTAGESYLVGTPLKTDRSQYGGLEWEFLSTEEIRVEGLTGKRTIKRNRAGRGTDGGYVTVEAFVTRMWNSDARYSDRAYSMVKRNLPICREIVVLTQVVDAIAKSRLAAGILFVPDEMSFGPEDEKENPGDDTDDIDEFTQELLEHLQAPVDDRTSAASLVPLILRGAAELGKEVRLIEVARDLDRLYQDLRQEAIGRLGGGLDIPPEVMAGKSGLNHWTGYNIDAEYVTKHVVPLAGGILDFITEAYMRPMLKTFEDMTAAEAGRFSLRYDPSPIMKRADSGPSARAAYDRIGVLSGEAYRRENGFDEADKPDDEETRRRLLEEILLRRPLEMAPIILPLLYPDEDLSGFPEVIVPVNEVGQGSPALTPGGGDAPVGDLEDGQDEPVPIEADASVGTDMPAAERELIDRLATAADAALERALEKAANRILSKLNGRDNEPLRDQLKSLDRHEVFGSTPSSVLTGISETPAGLMIGAWDTFADKSKGWIRAYMIEAGVETYLADDQADLITRELVEMLEVHAMSATRRPLRVGENGLRVPNELVERAMEASRSVQLAGV